MRFWPHAKVYIFLSACVITNVNVQGHHHLQICRKDWLNYNRCHVNTSRCAAISCRRTSTRHIHKYYNRSIRGALDVRPRPLSYDLTYATRRREERLQHAQAVQEHATVDEVEEDEAGTVDAGSFDDHVQKQKQSRLRLAPDVGEEVLNAVKHILTARAKATDQLFSVIGKYVPSATPIVQVCSLSSDKLQDDTGAPDDALEPLTVKIINDTHNLSCSQVFSPSEHTQASLEKLFDDTAWQYTKVLTTHLKANDIHALAETSHPYDQILTLLELEPLSVDCSAVEGHHNVGEHLQLYRAQAHVGQEAIGPVQIWTNALTAERLARASAKAEILRRAEQANIDLSLLEPADGAHKRKKPTNLPIARVLSKSRTYNASITQDCFATMLSTMRSIRDAGLPDKVALKALRPTGDPSFWSQSAQSELDKTSARIKLEQANMPISPKLKVMREKQSKLPIRCPNTSAHIIDLIDKNDVVVLVAETGSGKTTQLPQLLLENAIQANRGAACSIICTQPRRIAATSVAARVAQERGTYVGGSVGYQVRFDHQVPTEPGKINYATAGVLLKSLQEDDEQIFGGQYSHIVVDEVHERDLTVDLLVAVLRQSMRTRKSAGKHFPKIILMSATVEFAHYEDYFAQSCDDFSPRVASLTVSGRTYPVTPFLLDDIIPMLTQHYVTDRRILALLEAERKYLQSEDRFVDLVEQYGLAVEDLSTNWDKEEVQRFLDDNTDPWETADVPYGLIVATIAHILNNYSTGDILVFLPGMKEIELVEGKLGSQALSDLGVKNLDLIQVFKLHSALYETNARVFSPITEGSRRIILSTNIAQTSITLPHVMHVIDSGKQRAMTYDQISRRNEFVSGWIDQATSFQRRGRAGRVQHGYYWAMFTSTRFRMLAKTATPEIQSSDLVLSSLVLKSYASVIDLHEFFAATLDAPHAEKITACIKELQGLGMLTHEEKITPLGKFCSDFPLHPAIARGLLLGLMFNCFTPMMLVACHDSNSPIVYSPTARKEMYHSSLAFAGLSDDDRYAAIQAYMQYDEAIRNDDQERIFNLATKQFVKHEVYRTMNLVASQLYGILANDYNVLWRRERSVISDGRQSLWRVHDPSFDQNAKHSSLFKALTLTVSDTNLAVWDEEEQAWLSRDVVCMLKPYSVNTKQSLKLLEREEHRANGELVAYGGMIRNVLASVRPSLVESSRITPLTAMLFGGSVEVIDRDIIEIDGWLRYKMNVFPSRSVDSELDVSHPAKIILEFRKMINRWLTLVYSDVRKLPKTSPTERQSIPFNQHIVPNKLRDSIDSGLRAILEQDSQHWDEVVYLNTDDKAT